LDKTKATLTVPHRVESVRPATAFLVRAVRALDVPPARSSMFEVAVSEAITNAVRHGAASEPDATITCDLEVTPGLLTLRILDGHTQFGLPDRPPEPAPAVEQLREHGYGLPIIRSVFSDVRVIDVDGRFGIELGLRY
jgi:anti-sigma regulatory factor (Ser/Thr protein kinase)